ncbi:MAG: GMP/IMP nucleotidase [Cellvibrionaceae bacterium]
MINWKNIDTVLLDMDGTLLDLHYDNHFWMTHLPARYADIHNISAEESERKLHEHILSLEGTLNWYCLDYWSESLGIDIPALKRETKDKIKERPHVDTFLSALKNNNKHIYLVTNSHPAGIDIKLAETNIAPYFTEIISSHQFKHPKEQQAFWQSLSSYIDFDPKRTLFIDDNITVLNAAVDFGIKHILGIHQPDSQKQRLLSDVPAIHHFDEIMIGLNP